MAGAGWRRFPPSRKSKRGRGFSSAGTCYLETSGWYRPRPPPGSVCHKSAGPLRAAVGDRREEGRERPGCAEFTGNLGRRLPGWLTRSDPRLRLIS